MQHPIIGFIGAGKVGCTLGRYFYNCGFPIHGYCSRTPDSAKIGAGLTDSKVLTLAEVAAGSDPYFPGKYSLLPGKSIQTVITQR